MGIASEVRVSVVRTSEAPKQRILESVPNLPPKGILIQNSMVLMSLESTQVESILKSTGYRQRAKIP